MFNKINLLAFFLVASQLYIFTKEYALSFYISYNNF